MRRWIVGAAVVGALGLAAALGAAAGEGGAKAPVPEPPPDLDRFLFFATFEGLCEDGMADGAVKAVLEEDAEGRFRHFVYACPVCSPVLEGFRAYAMREKYYHGRKGDPLVPWHDADNPSPVAGIEARLTGEDRAARPAALHDFVERCVRRRMERLRLTEAEKGAWKGMLEEARRKGMALLPKSSGFDPKSSGFEHGSCPSCDGATGQDWKPGK